jgi:hypothetical protein
MLAFRPGLYNLLLPELEPAFRELIQKRDWTAVAQARTQALARLRQTAASLAEILASRDSYLPPALLAEITRRYLVPLGL